MADEQAAQEAIDKIKTAIQSGNMHFPAKVEEHGVFPLKFKDDDGNYEFHYVSMRGAFPERADPDRPERNHNGGFILEWGAKGVGFGELTFKSVGGEKDEDTGEIKGAKMVCDSEYMSRDFVRAALVHFANTVEII